MSGKGGTARNRKSDLKGMIARRLAEGPALDVDLFNKDDRQWNVATVDPLLADEAVRNKADSMDHPSLRYPEEAARFKYHPQHIARGGSARNPLGKVDKWYALEEQSLEDRFPDMYGINPDRTKRYGGYEFVPEDGPGSRRTSNKPDVNSNGKPKQKDAEVEKWRPHENYDKFRKPGFWRGDEAVPNAKPATRIERRSSIDPMDIPLEAAKERLAMEGRYGDTEVAHVNPREKALLASLGGAGTLNPDTGMVEFYDGGESGSDATGGGNAGNMGGADPGGSQTGSESGTSYSDIGLSTQDPSPNNPFNNNDYWGNQNEPGPYNTGSPFTTPTGPYRSTDFDTEYYENAMAAQHKSQVPGFQGEAQMADDASSKSLSGNFFPGFFQDPGGYIGAKAQGFANTLKDDPFGTIAGLIAGGVAGALVGPAVGAFAGPVAGKLAGMAAGNIVGNKAQDVVTSAVNNQQATPALTSANYNAPAGLQDFNTRTPGNRESGDSPNYDTRLAPLTTAAVNPLAVQPTTTVADSPTPTARGPFIPMIGRPTPGWGQHIV